MIKYIQHIHGSFCCLCYCATLLEPNTVYIRPYNANVFHNKLNFFHYTVSCYGIGMDFDSHILLVNVAQHMEMNFKNKTFMNFWSSFRMSKNGWKKLLSCYWILTV